MATIIDVAKLAGVSQGTASNVLNGKGNVSSEKIRAVEEAARRTGLYDKKGPGFFAREAEISSV